MSGNGVNFNFQGFSYGWRVDLGFEKKLKFGVFLKG